MSDLLDILNGIIATKKKGGPIMELFLILIFPIMVLVELLKHQ